MSTQQVRSLNPLTFPLQGQRLIEASAGTGKTFTIAALYVRLVLGHGDQNTGFGRSLLPYEILVVTFTNAATRELRDRIRSRLADAARVFRDQARPDPFLQQLLAEPEFAAAEARALAARKLERAAEWMDEAAVYTIHGWCQRMLTQHALDTGSLFRQQLEQNDAELLTEMARDYWRSWCYSLSSDVVEALSELASDPDSLLLAVKPLLQPGERKVHYRGSDLSQAITPVEYAQQLNTWLPRKKQLEDEARTLWLRDREQIEEELTRAVENKILNNNSYRPASLPAKLAEMAAWAGGESLAGDKLAHFGQAKLTAKTARKKQGQTPDHPVFECLQRLVEHLQQKPPVQPVLQHAAGWIQRRFDRAREQAATLGFNDMLVRLDRALDGGGDALAATIRTQYPVALIDEFQDTDPLQYRIFSRIYGDHASPGTPAADTSSRHALLMIGDPKQAIYAFRGADIHTYLKARRDTRGRHYTLGCNYRSSRSLVMAVNRLFTHAEEHQATGAFRFAHEGENPVPFIPVDANGRKETLVIADSTQGAVTCWLLEDDEDEGVAMGDYLQRMAEHTASEICRLLKLAQQQQAGFRTEAGLTPLRPADIAILVRNGNEANEIRTALARRNIRSVYLSDQASVYAGTEAEDLWRWLRACAEPEQPGLLQGALASTTLDLSYAELERVTRDERQWEAMVEQFRYLREIWQRQGILPMIRRLLDSFDLPARLLQKPGGERVLTNLLHLAELLQTASSQLEGEQALIRHLQEQILDKAPGGDEHIMRLESDADLVQVVTIHKAKGLEYPLVFLPFISACREVSARDGSYRYHTEQGAVLELDKQNSVAKEAADAERLQEDLRLLYVALTRPIYACWLGVAAIKTQRALSLHKSALGQLLCCEPETDSATLRKRLGSLASPGLIEVVSPPEITTEPLPDIWQGEELSPARTCDQPVAREHWWIASYSAISRLQGQARADLLAEPEPAEDAREETARESLDEPRSLLTQDRENTSLHQFWKGPQAGTFLHGVMEWAADEGFGTVAADTARRRDFLAPRCQRRTWQPWLPVLDEWLQQLLTTPLPLGECTLSLTQLKQYQAEMEFWLEVEQVPVTRLDQLITRQVLPGQSRPALAPQKLGGMLKGFIDLVFEHEGRYWVVDYKSNWLGTGNSAYTLEAMQKAVLKKRYDVQYVIYLVALHRLLKARLPGYAADPLAGYERHVGGALYLFLRGIGEPMWHGCCVDRPPGTLIEALDRLLANGEGADG